MPVIDKNEPGNHCRKHIAILIYLILYFYFAFRKNKMKTIFFTATVIVIVLAACKTTATTTGATASVNDTLSDYSFKKVTRDKELYNATSELVPVDTAYLVKDTLHILTKKIMGCDADNFKLFWNGALMKSLPPQTSVKLFQQVNAECKQQHLFHLTYNIKSLRLKNDTVISTLDSAVTKTMLLRIGGYKEMVKYAY